MTEWEEPAESHFDLNSQVFADRLGLAVVTKFQWVLPPICSSTQHIRAQTSPLVCHLVSEARARPRG